METNISTNNSSAYTDAPNAPIPLEFVYPIAFWIFLAAECMLIILGNGMLIWLFSNTRHLRTQQNYFVMSLSISDLLVGLTIPPCEYCALMHRTTQTVNPNCTMFCGSVFTYNMLASTMNLVLIAADRFFSIMRPFQYQKLLSKSRARIVIFVAWFFTFLFVAAPFSWELSKSMDYPLKMKVNLSYIISLFVLVFLIGLLLGVAYFKIVRTIQSKLKEIKGSPSNTTGIKVCILVAISFFLCWIPTCITEILMQKNARISQAWMNTAYFILLMNPCLDPIMYAYYRRDFRQELSQWRQRRWKGVKSLYDRLFSPHKELENGQRDRSVRLNLNNNLKDERSMTTVEEPVVHNKTPSEVKPMLR